jgi:hypothetical protein
MVKRLMNDKDYYLSQARRPLPKDKFSNFRGVQKNSNPKKPYRASFRYKGMQYTLGAFETELEAARAYNKAASAVIGDYAILNDLSEYD